MITPHIKRLNGLWRVTIAGQLAAHNLAAWKWCQRMNAFAPYREQLMFSPIRTEDLKDGAYYEGECRNATVARWNAKKQRFVYRREKFGIRFFETIPNYGHPDWKYDWFRAEREVPKPDYPIPLWLE